MKVIFVVLAATLASAAASHVRLVRLRGTSRKFKRFSDPSLQFNSYGQSLGPTGGLAAANFSPFGLRQAATNPWVPIVGSPALDQQPAYAASAPAAPQFSEVPQNFQVPQDAQNFQAQGAQFSGVSNQGPQFPGAPLAQHPLFSLTAPAPAASTAAPTTTPAPTEAPATEAPATEAPSTTAPDAIPTGEPILVRQLPPIVTLGVAGPFASAQLSLDALEAHFGRQGLPRLNALGHVPNLAALGHVPNSVAFGHLSAAGFNDFGNLGYGPV